MKNDSGSRIEQGTSPDGSVGPTLKRDPRVDPRPGDIVASKGLGCHPFTIDIVHQDGTITGHFGKRGTPGSLCGLHYWRTEWARDGVVIRVGPTEAEAKPEQTMRDPERKA